MECLAKKLVPVYITKNIVFGNNTYSNVQWRDEKKIDRKNSTAVYRNGLRAVWRESGWRILLGSYRNCRSWEKCQFKWLTLSLFLSVGPRNDPFIQTCPSGGDEFHLQNLIIPHLRQAHACLIINLPVYTDHVCNMLLVIHVCFTSKPSFLKMNKNLTL